MTVGNGRPGIEHGSVGVCARAIGAGEWSIGKGKLEQRVRHYSAASSTTGQAFSRVLVRDGLGRSAFVCQCAADRKATGRTMYNIMT